MALVIVALPAVCTAAPGGRRVALHLDLATSEQAYAALAKAADCRFALADGERWVGPEVPVTLALDDASFWEAFQAVGKQTGYDPVFVPAVEDNGVPVIQLRRVDVRAEQTPLPAVASGPLLVRPGGARFSIDATAAKRQLIPVQIALDLEVFVEPGLDGVYVAAAGGSAFDGDGGALRRADARDPTAAVVGGTAALSLYFDARPKVVPAAVGKWQALLRLVTADGRADVRVPLDAAAPQTVQAGDLKIRVEPTQFPATAPATAPATRPAAVSVSLIVSSTRAYDLAAATPLGLEDAAGRLWARTSSATLLVPSGPAEGAPDVLRVVARFAAPPDVGAASGPLYLRWPLPTHTSDSRQLVRWSSPISVKAAATPVTRPNASP